MAIYVRNQDGEMESYKIVGLKGEDGITPNISIGTVTTLEAGEKATVVNSGTKENPIFDFGIPKGANGTGEGNASIDDSTISTEKTWSSSKIEDFVLTNVGAIWKDINGGQMVIDSTMDGFLREVEILGNTTQNQEDLSDIQHLGVWNEAKQGYEIEICVSNSSSKDDLNYQEYRTTIVLPCQLMKVGDNPDRLYWDKNKGKYIIQKNIEIYKPSSSTINSLRKDGNANNGYQTLMEYLDNSTRDKINNNWHATTDSYSNLFKATNNAYLVNNNEELTALIPHALFIKYKVDKYEDLNSFKKILIENDFYVLYKQSPQLIETDITEEIKLPTFMNNTYVYVNGGIQGGIKAKAPVDGGKVIGVLQEENIKLKETNEEQDKLINTTMLVADEMYSLLEPLFIDMLINKDVSPLLNMYVAMVKRELKKIEQVPEKYRELVDNIINNK